MGQIQQASGDPSGAYDSFQRAREALETLRSSLHGEELKIAFMKNRLEVYECLVELCIGRDERREFRARNHSATWNWPNREAWPNARATRSRAAGGGCGPERFCPPDPRNARGVELVLPPHRTRTIAHRRSIAGANREASERGAGARKRTASRAARSSRAPSHRRNCKLRVRDRVSETIRECLPPETALVEYFSVKDQFVAAVVTRDALEIVPVTPFRASSICCACSISRFRNSASARVRTQTFEKPLLDAMQAHLAPTLRRGIRRGARPVARAGTS